MFRPEEFIECDNPQDLSANKTKDGSDGCYKVPLLAVKYINIFIMHVITSNFIVSSMAEASGMKT